MTVRVIRGDTRGWRVYRFPPRHRSVVGGEGQEDFDPAALQRALAEGYQEGQERGFQEGHEEGLAVPKAISAAWRKGAPRAWRKAACRAGSSSSRPARRWIA